MEKTTGCDNADGELVVEKIVVKVFSELGSLPICWVRGLNANGHIGRGVAGFWINGYLIITMSYSVLSKTL